MAGACNPAGRTMIDGRFSKREKKTFMADEGQWRQ